MELERRIALLGSLTALVLAGSALVLTLMGRSGGPAAEYRLEKLNEVTDLVLERQVVPQDYLRYLDEDLAQAVENYNLATAQLKSNYSVYAENLVHVLIDDTDAPRGPEAYQQEERYYRMVDRISTLALFQNCYELCLADPYLSFTLAHEAGGSAGLWAYTLHEPGYVGEGLAGQATAYFTQVEELLDQLDGARAP